jgi:hypothetical protein
MNRFYIETSAVNYLLEHLNGEGAESTRRLQLSKGNEWYISTTVLWELLQITDRSHLDTCLFLSSYLFNDHLLKSAAEIIIEYIDKGKPSYQVLESPFTNSEIGNHWKKACKDKSYSFFIESPGFEKFTSFLKTVSKHIRYLTHDRKTSTSPTDDFQESLSLFVEEVYEAYFNDDVSSMVKSLRKISIIVLYFQICLGLDLTSDVIGRFWETKKISDPLERLIFLLDNHLDVVRHGPIWNISNAIMIQCTNLGRSSRGAFHDGLHSIYLPFIDFFITCDKHFCILRDKSKENFRDLYYKKIVHLDEADIKRVQY